ncbi:MAG TPA: hypothetical protein VFQ61_21930 [Polyangiaceae bacterium]|nr:hypothetical protein [Polyangiaceae bacterium]
MPYAVNCNRCGARFNVSDELYRRKFVGKVVTLRCQRCNAPIRVDATDPPTNPKIPVAAPAYEVPAQKGAPKPPARALEKSGEASPPPPPVARGSLNPADSATGATNHHDLFAIDSLPPLTAGEYVDLSEGLQSEPPASSAPPLAALTRPIEPAPESVPRPSDRLLNIGSNGFGGAGLGASFDPSTLPRFSTPPPDSEGSPRTPRTAFHNPFDSSKPANDVPVASSTSQAAIGHERPASEAVPGGSARVLASASDTSSGHTAPASVRRGLPVGSGRLEGVGSGAADESTQHGPQRRSMRWGVAVVLAVAITAAVVSSRKTLSSGQSAGAETVIAKALQTDQHTSNEPTPSTPATRPEAAAPLAGNREGDSSAADVDASKSSSADASSRRSSANRNTETTPNGAARSSSLRSTPGAGVTGALTQAEARVIARNEPRADAARAESARTGLGSKREPAPSSEPVEAEPAEPPAPAIPKGPFDRAAAASALQGAAAQAGHCRKPGDPSGVATVTVTFAPSGRVTSATLSGPPFAGTATGGCIASTLRRAQVPAFDGDKITVSKTIAIE